MAIKPIDVRPINIPIGSVIIFGAEIVNVDLENLLDAEFVSFIMYSTSTIVFKNQPAIRPHESLSNFVLKHPHYKTFRKTLIREDNGPHASIGGISTSCCMGSTKSSLSTRCARADRAAPNAPLW
jgi:hypothetical protein